MKKQKIHWLSQKYTDLFNGTIAISIFLPIIAILLCYCINAEIYTYYINRNSYIVAIGIVFLLYIFTLIMIPINFRYLVKKQKCDLKFSKFLILLILCLLSAIISLSVTLFML